MRCSKCNSDIPEGDRACPVCGEPANAKKCSRKPVVIIIILLVLLLAAAAAVGIALKKNGCAPDKDADATAAPTETAAPVITEAPVETTDAPADTTFDPDSSEDPQGEETPAPSPDINVTEPELRRDDTPPIDALVSFMLKGDPDSARKALPAGYITYLSDQYGFAAKLLGENNVIRVAGLVVKKNLADQYGTISEISYDLISRRMMTEAEMDYAVKQLKELGVEDEPTEGHWLELTLKFKSDTGDQTLYVAPRVLLIDDVWYLHPADIDSMTT